RARSSDRPVGAHDDGAVIEAITAPSSCGQTPFGCQTVLVSVNARMRCGRGASVQSGSASSPRRPGAGRRTRFTESAAAASTSPHVTPSAPTAPARSIALTSRCDASGGASSLVKPVRTLTTPPGTSDVASTSDSVTAGIGRRSLATTITELPVTSGGTIVETRPSSDERCGASTTTTPVGSGDDKLKYGPATGLAEPATCATLSVQPAYQTQ